MAKFSPFTPKTTESPDSVNWGKTGRLSDKIFYGDIANAQGAVKASHTELDSAYRAVKTAEATAMKGTPIPEATQTAFNDAARNFNRNVENLKYNHGKLGTSIKGMFKSWADTLHIPGTENWSSAKISVSKGSKDVMGDALVNAKKIKGNVFERILSKPFRLAAESPKTSLVVGGLAAVAAAGSFFHRRAARRTENDALIEAANVQASQIPTAQANVTYQTTPEEFALMQARMRGNGTPTTGHADSLIARQEQAGQQAQPGVAASV